MVLLGAISGRRIGTSCAADSYFSANTWVTIWSPRAEALSCGPMVVPDCNLASASGTIFTISRPSTAAYPWRRKADTNTSYTSDRDMGLEEMMLTVPLTRGSRTKFRPVISLTALTTPSMSAFTKLSVTSSGLAGRTADWDSGAAVRSAPARGGRFFVAESAGHAGPLMATAKARIDRVAAVGR